SRTGDLAEDCGPGPRHQASGAKPWPRPLGLAFARRGRVDRERMHAVREFLRERLVDHAVAVDPALPTEDLRHDIDAVVGLPARPVARMALVAVRLVLHPQARGGEGRGQLFGDNVGDAPGWWHGRWLAMPRAGVNGVPVAECGRTPPKRICQACGLWCEVRIMMGHEIRLAPVRPNSRQAGPGSPAARVAAVVRLAGLRARRDPSRPEGAWTGAGVLELLPRTRARV